MIREETFMGELVNPSSPQISESEAISNASFGQYNYSPGSQYTYPGQYGYNSDISRYTNPPPIGIGSPVTFSATPCTPQYGYYQNMPAFGGVPQMNPAFAWQNRLYQQQSMFQEPQQFKSFIKPVGINGEFLPPADFEERLSKLMRDYWVRQEEEDVERRMQQQSMYGYNNSWGGYNYYGTPYYSPYQGYSRLQQEVAQLIEDMKAEAREARIEFNKNLSRLAHNIAKEHVDEDMLDERYRGKYVETPGLKGITVQDMSEQIRLANMKPFDNSGVYREFQEKVSTEFREIITNDMGFVETFRNMGVVQAKYELEEEKVRRKNGAVLYDSNSGTYRYFVRAKAAQRYAEKHGLSVDTLQPNTGMTISATSPLNKSIDDFPTLKESATLLEDGTLKITCNFGSHKGEVYSVKDSQEKQYNDNRERFARFYNSIPGSIYLTNPNSGGGSSG